MEKINQDAILRSISSASCNINKFLAPDNAYAKLVSCCQYVRAKIVLVKVEEPKMKMGGTDDSAHIIATEAPRIDQMKPVSDSYFAVKDALVPTGGALAFHEINRFVKSD